MCEINVFCRTCMYQFPNNSVHKLERYSIFQIPDLADKLMHCTNLPIQPFDEYPQLVCGKCFEKVKDFDEFQKMCRESLKTFKDILKIERNVIDCENATNFVSTADNTSIKEQEVSQCELDGKGSLNIDNLIQFATDDDDFIIEDDGSVYDDGSSQLEELEINHMDDIKNLNDDTYLSVNAEHIQKSVPAEREQVDEYKLLSEEECVVDTLSEKDENESHTHSPENISPHDFNPATILKYPFYCDLCPKVFRYKHCLQAHKRRHQGLAAYPCSRKNCKRAYSRLCDLRQHMREHDGIPREIYKCDINNCGKEYTTKSAINLHMRKQHNFGPVAEVRKCICDICGLVLSNARSLQEHHFTHVDKSHWPFGCDVNGCTSRFRKVAQLREHKTRHSGIKPFGCSYCKKRFYTSSNLSVHINYHTQKKKWTCHVCAREFFTPASLRLHVQKEHDPNRIGDRFPCRICDKALSTHTARKYHEMRHNGEKPYVCEECGRGFTHPSGLKTHKRVHLKMESRKEFVCQLCDRAFTSSASLKHHEMKHTGEKPYECKQCGIRFRYPTSFSRHRTQNLCKKKNKEN